jgi:Putative Flp pilus-assembly TadE/G-like
MLPYIRNRVVRASREGGQTIAVVAVSMVSVLAMAALAIDLTTLYVARGEIQRAADAAALAGAKAFVDSGVTTNPSSPTLQNMATTMAGDFATAVLSQNKVAGATPQFINGTPTVSLTFSIAGSPNIAGNPRIMVTLQRPGLPLFFARVWGGSVASVSATAIAEAYNPAYAQNNTGTFIPPAPKCVKPFLLPNQDPNQPKFTFVDPSSGAVTTAPISFIGETIALSSACKGNGNSGCKVPKAPSAGEYLPMFLPNVHTYCPSSSAPSCSGAAGGFESSTECCDGATFDFNQCGVSGTMATWDPNTNPGGSKGPAQQGLQCLIHKPQQDALVPANGQMQIQPGPYTQARYNVAPGSLISTSDSIITVPLFDLTKWNGTQQVTIVGFLQLFVNDVGGSGPGPGQPDMSATILNVIGCGQSLTSGAAISGGGASAIPVRLIHN